MRTQVFCDLANWSVFGSHLDHLNYQVVAKTASGKVVARDLATNWSIRVGLTEEAFGSMGIMASLTIFDVIVVC